MKTLTKALVFCSLLLWTAAPVDAATITTKDASGVTRTFVTLQRPPPDIKIFLPALLA